MTQRTYCTGLEIYVNGRETALTASVQYSYERESGNDWDEPRTPESCSIESVEVTGDDGKTLDLYPLLPADCVMGLAADCLEHEREARQPDPDYLRELRSVAAI